MADSIETITVEEFLNRCRAQGVSAREHIAFKCPMCGTVQSIASIQRATGLSSATAERNLGFNCVGRFTEAPGPREKPDGKPCNWTLGGVFKFHKLEVLGPNNGKALPQFEFATPDEARALEVETVVSG